MHARFFIVIFGVHLFLQTFGTFLSTPCVKLPSESIFNRIYPEKRNNCQRIDKFRGIVIKKEENP